MDKLIKRFVRYLQYERNASPHTIRNYQSDLVQFRLFLSEGNPDAPVNVASIDALRIRGFLSHLFSGEKKKTSIARKLAAVRAFFKFLSREHVLSANPATTVSTPKLDKTLPRIMTEEEMNTFLDQVAKAAQSLEPAILRDRAILELLYASGLRVSELVGIDLRGVNFGEGMVLVRGKGNKERIVPFGSKARHALTEYLAPRFRVSPADRRSGLARHPGNAGPQKPGHHSEIYPGFHQTTDRGLRQSAPQGMRGVDC
jgi:integrase/recombinase XerC